MNKITGATLPVLVQNSFSGAIVPAVVKVLPEELSGRRAGEPERWRGF